MEYGMIAINLMKKLTKEMKKEDFFIFEKWIEEYITNWAHCDIFCSDIIGNLIEKYPELEKNVINWAKSKNRWQKRASAVSFVLIVQHDKKYIKPIFTVSEILMKDHDDLIQKSYGWALKRAAEFHKKETIPFLMKHKKTMPRTALRYACEKLSAKEKERILK